MKINNIILALSALVLALTTQIALADTAKPNLGIIGADYIHNTHINTNGRTIRTNISFGVGTGIVGACNIQVQGIPATANLKDMDVRMTSRTIASYGLNFTCLKASYTPVSSGQPITIEYNLIMNAQGTEYIDSNPNSQIVDLSNS